jgi:UDP-N-acetylglucosamine pyrophosphorylase
MTPDTSKITIILPCAGSGSRLGLSEPKELFEISPEIRLIDFSSAHIAAAHRKRIFFRGKML